MTSKVRDSTREATLTYLLREGASNSSCLAEVMRISVQAMRKHLRSLELEGFVVSSLISDGPGRPSNLWQLTSQGQNLFKFQRSIFCKFSIK